MIKPFKKLPLGTRFQYIEAGKRKTWVKIGCDRIAEWDETKKNEEWMGQLICSFGESEEDVNMDVIVL